MTHRAGRFRRCTAAASWFALCCIGLFGCQGRAAPKVSDAEHADAEPEQPLPVSRQDLPGFCQHPGADAVRDAFCGPEAPQIFGLHDLQRILELNFEEPGPETIDQQNTISGYSTYRDRRVLLLNTSTALSANLVSTLNPRAIVLGQNSIFAFNRGIQRVELISRDREDRTSNFYLLSFEQDCNAAADGCAAGDLYTPRIESDWTRIRIENDEQLKNTPLDCRQCHQRGREQPMLLMRELDGPWTHFFMPDQDQPEGIPEPSGVDVVRGYHDAKGDERYGGIPWDAIRATVGFTLQEAVERPQPLVFDGSTIMNERWPWTRDHGFASEPVPSATWYSAYEAFKRGEHLALPYFDPFPSDPDKLAQLSEAYQRYRNGVIAAEELPDLADVFPEDPQTRAEIGLQSEPGATPAQTLVQVCGSCHNDVLDQQISRARFNIDLARLDRAELELAVIRISLPDDDPSQMPPREFRKLDNAARDPLIRYLQDGVRSREDDALLQNAARLGMANTLGPPRMNLGDLVP
jgi:hypothetical protein